MPHSITRPLVTSLLLGLLAVSHAHGFSPTVGVKAGDWAHYDVGQHITGNATLTKTTEAKYNTYNNTRYVGLNITSVRGTNVSLTQGIYHTNGTIISTSITVDVSVNIDQSNPPLIIMQDYPPTLSSITTGNFSGVPRTIDSLVVSSQVGGNSSALRYSWDNATGILLSEQFLYTFDVSNSNNATFTYTLSMTTTSLWHYVPPRPPVSNPPTNDQQFAEIYSIVAVVGALTLGVVAYARTRPRHGKRAAKRRA